jgi:hypothetical protein
MTGPLASVRSGLLLIVPLLLAGGCRQLLSTSDYKVATDAPDGAAGAACVLAVPVDPPAEKNVPGDNEYTFVVRRFDVGDGSLGDGGLTPGTIGYDIDGECTTSSTPARCKASSAAALDGPGGRDNALGVLITRIPTLVRNFPLTVQVMNQEVESGRTPPQGLFRVRGYGGDRNDDHVEVDWLLPSSLPSADSAQVTAPTWTSNDRWPVFSDSFTRAVSTFCGPADDAQASAPEKRTSLTAYVSDQHLVAHFPDGLPIRFWVFEAPLVDVVMTADLIFDFNSQTIAMKNGVISGRAPAIAVLHDIPTLQQLTKTEPECRSDSLYPATKAFICSGADWSCAADSAAACDWYSVGIAFETAPASVGETIPDLDLPDPCPGDEDPGTDSCAN